jgi:hypothetical protein
MNVDKGLRPRNSFSGNIFSNFRYCVFALQCMEQTGSFSAARNSAHRETGKEKIKFKSFIVVDCEGHKGLFKGTVA